MILQNKIQAVAYNKISSGKPIKFTRPNPPEQNLQTTTTV